MEILIKVIQGAYAYVLIFQVLIVSLLMLTLLAMIIRRTKLAALSPEATATVTPEAVATTAAANATVVTTVVKNEDAEKEIAELKNKVAIYEADLEKTKPMSDQNKTLLEKVKYLESKLLEYEILQEEIGALSSLKLENEELKKKVVNFKSEEVATPSGEAPTALVDEPQASAPVGVDPIQLVSTPAKEPLAVFVDPPNEPAQETSSPTAEGGEMSPESLENLLKQIDQLTKTSG